MVVSCSSPRTENTSAAKNSPNTSAAISADSTNFNIEIKDLDLSGLWHGDSIITEGDGEKIPFPEPLGYIGDNYQRFYIHYSSVVKSKDNPYLYYVTGKTRVKENICNFKGTIIIQQATLYKQAEIPEFDKYKTGSLIGSINFYEDSSQGSAGYIRGKISTDFYIDQQQQIHYNALFAVADGFCNNQCEATWISYKTGRTKKCNWGDYRIPDSNELDKGDGGIVINDKYIRNGWESFKSVYSSNEKEAEEALRIENEEWWK